MAAVTPTNLMEAGAYLQQNDPWILEQLVAMRARVDVVIKCAQKPEFARWVFARHSARLVDNRRVLDKYGTSCILACFVELGLFAVYGVSDFMELCCEHQTNSSINALLVVECQQRMVFVCNDLATFDAMNYIIKCQQGRFKFMRSNRTDVCVVECEQDPAHVYDLLGGQTHWELIALEKFGPTL